MKVLEFLKDVSLDEKKFSGDYTYQLHTFWPSQSSIELTNGQIEGTCCRKVFYQIMKVPITNPAKLTNERQRTYGNLIEISEVNRAKIMNILVSTQERVIIKHENITIRGKTDAIYKINEQNTGVEFKTVYGWDAKKKIFTQRIPKISHVLQAMLYLDGEIENPEHKFDNISLIYLDRGSGDAIEFELTLDSGFVVIDGQIDRSLHLNSIYKRFLQLDYYIINNQLPPNDFDCFIDEKLATEKFNEGFMSKTQFEDNMRKGYGEDRSCSWCEWRDRCRLDLQTS